jgi:hypothetical protein
MSPSRLISSFHTAGPNGRCNIQGFFTNQHEPSQATVLLSLDLDLMILSLQSSVCSTVADECFVFIVRNGAGNAAFFIDDFVPAFNFFAQLLSQAVRHEREISNAGR